MPKLREVCRHVRTKNAGPFWITLDMFFKDAESFDRYAQSPSLGAAQVAQLLGIDDRSIKRFLVPNLHVLKMSYPRRHPQGGSLERDMHGGQQYVSLLDVEL
ncbi:DUF4387 domain-containing protein [Sphingomonas sp.]|uniref:DUF4387 domain-containing protein n=1 Tax=Sphingomonas sp. TaxID=28214 RepID=UPI003CC6048C